MSFIADEGFCSIKNNTKIDVALKEILRLNWIVQIELTPPKSGGQVSLLKSIRIVLNGAQLISTGSNSNVKLNH